MTATPPTTPASDAMDRLLADFDARKPAALARAVSIVENHRAGFDRLLGALHSRLGRARRVGITGPPGAGKSTMTTALAAALRSRGESVGIIAVDPTSPFTGGALLGDRIRMERVALDPGVFIRSLATRGSLGGLSSATREVSDVLDAYGFDWILLETVGVGQSELDISRAADTTVVMLVPESGDAIQTLKAGLMEIADIFVVNKADRPGADRLRHDIEVMLGIRGGSSYGGVPAHHGVDLKRMVNPARAAREAAATDDQRWTAPVLRAVAAKDEGIEALLEALARHRGYLEATGELRNRRRQRMRERVLEVVEHKVRRRLWGDEATLAWLDAKLLDLEQGRATPYDVADAVLARSGDLLTRPGS